jgi:predicted membrane protein
MDRYEYRMQRAQWKAERRRHRSPAAGILFGGLIVAAGLLLLLNNMNIIRMRDVWEYWPIILVVFGLSRIFECHTPSSLIWGGLVAGIGALLFLDNLHILTIDFNFIWPLILIAFGLSLLWRAVDRRFFDNAAPVFAGPSNSIMAVFSGGKRKIDSADFKGSDVLAIFGGVEIDLRDAKISGEQAVIDVNATFGGVEIRVPETWSVVVKTVAIFGGVDDKTIPPKPDPNVPAPRLVLTGTAVFGGVSIKN